MQLDFISARGDILPLVNNEYFTITNIDGMTAATTSISSNVVGGFDGDIVNNIQAQPRSIVIDLRISPTVDVEEAKREILRVIKLKQYGALLWTHNDRTVTISGLVESVDMPRWNNSVVMQISLYCDSPFWEDVDYVVSQIRESVDLHYFTDNAADMLYFPFDGVPFGEFDTLRYKPFYNAGDVAVGLEITIIALDTVTNPIIYDQYGNFFGLGYTTESESTNPNIGSAWASKPFIMHAGDTVVITTHKGNKTVKYNGQSAYNFIKPNSTWLQLETGDNFFNINSDEENLSNMHFNISYKQRYI